MSLDKIEVHQASKHEVWRKGASAAKALKQYMKFVQYVSSAYHVPYAPTITKNTQIEQ